MNKAKYNSKLISFLYSLLRDELPAGVVERLVRDSQISDTTFTNGYLADYAKDIADRLQEDLNEDNNSK